MKLSVISLCSFTSKPLSGSSKRICWQLSQSLDHCLLLHHCLCTFYSLMLSPAHTWQLSLCILTLQPAFCLPLTYLFCGARGCERCAGAVALATPPAAYLSSVVRLGFRFRGARLLFPPGPPNSTAFLVCCSLVLQ